MPRAPAAGSGGALRAVAGPLLVALLVPPPLGRRGSTAAAAEAGRYRREDFRIVTPDFFDCTGPGYDPIWDEYYEAAFDWDQGIEAALNKGGGNSPELLQLGTKVANLSHYLLDTYFAALQDMQGTALDKVIHRKMTPAELNGVCYYGLVQALWVRTQLIMLQPNSEQKVQEAILELRTAMAIIGEDFRADFLESSRWPVKSHEISSSIAAGAISKVPRFRHINVPDLISAVFTFEPRNFFTAPMRQLPASQEGGLLKLAAFGQHVALLSEPVTMIRGAFPEWQVITHWFLAQCRWRDPMHHYMCRLSCSLIGECHFFDDNDNLGRRILKYVEYVAEDHVSLDLEDLEAHSTIGELLDVTAQLWDEDLALQSVHLIVCTVPLVCSLLRSVSPIPILGYFAMTYFSRPKPGIGEWGMVHWAEMAKNSRQNAFAVPNENLMGLAALQTAIRLPVIPPFGLYHFPKKGQALFPNPFARLLPGTASYPNSVVVPRSWLVTETSFLRALRFFLEGIEPAFPLNFTVTRSSSAPDKDINMARDPHPSGERLSDLLDRDDNVFVDSAIMMVYRCAVMLPQQANMLTFNELHSMNLPMFIPGREWLFRMWKMKKSAKGSPVKDRRSPRPRPFQPPMFSPNAYSVTGGPLNVWLFNYDRYFNMHMPGIRTFESFGELIEGLLFDDLPLRREQMRQWNEREFKPVLRWYRAAVLHLVGGPPHYLLGRPEEGAEG